MSFPVSFYVYGEPVSVGSHALNDTGQTQCDNGSNVLATCTNANSGDTATYPRQDGRFGRDAKATAGTLTKFGAGAAGFDYTKVNNVGGDLPATATLGSAAGDWACTRDNITGLTWEVKVNNASHLRHMNWTYTWYNSDNSTNGGDAGLPDTGAGVGSDNCLNTSRCDTEKFVADVKAAALCGNTDWRMPTRRELHNLVHFGLATSPTIDTNYFPGTTATDTEGPGADSWISYWTSDTINVYSFAAWTVDFSYGFSQEQNNKATSYHVRLVHSGP